MRIETKRLLSASALALAIASRTASGNVMDCTANGKDINLNNGNSTKGLTATVVCRFRDSQEIQREERYVNGVEVWQRFYKEGKPSSERFVNQNGNTEGLSKEFYPNGQLKSECNYRNGEHDGLCKTFYRDGKPERIAFTKGSDTTELTFNEDGSLREIQCSKASYSKQDREYCGFQGSPSRVTLYSKKGHPYKELSYMKGELVSTKTISETGQVVAEHELATQDKNGLKIERHPNGRSKSEMHYNKEGKLDGLQREYADSGKLTRDASFHDGLMQVEKLYYLNGQLKRLTEKKQENKRVFVTSKQYFDNGRLMRSGTFIEEQEVDNFGWGRYWDYSYLKPEGRLEEWREDGTRLYIETYKDGAQDGVSTYYFKDGKSIQREAVYEKGRMTRKKEYDEGGKLTLNEEYFEDGSRKSYSIK